MAASRGELILREQLPKPHELQAAIDFPEETHSAKTDPSVACVVLNEDDLVRR